MIECAELSPRTQDDARQLTQQFPQRGMRRLA
jgi:hypothetical protein